MTLCPEPHLLITCGEGVRLSAPLLGRVCYSNASSRTFVFYPAIIPPPVVTARGAVVTVATARGAAGV